MKFKILLFFVSAIALASCVDIPDFSDVPKIYYNSIDHFTETDDATGKKVRENVVITIDFEDGDGDLGASSEERSLPAFTQQYKQLTGWRLGGNYELVTMRKELNGKWTESIVPGDSVKWMPILKVDGKPGPIKGKLDLNTSFLYGNSTVPVTFKFKVRIVDRHLHISNQTPETDTIIVPAYR